MIGSRKGGTFYVVFVRKINWRIVQGFLSIGYVSYTGLHQLINSLWYIQSKSWVGQNYKKCDKEEGIFILVHWLILCFVNKSRNLEYSWPIIGFVNLQKVPLFSTDNFATSHSIMVSGNTSFCHSDKYNKNKLK